MSKKADRSDRFQRCLDDKTDGRIRRYEVPTEYIVYPGDIHKKIDDHVRRYEDTSYLYSPHTDRAYDIFDRDHAVDLHRDISRLNRYDRTRRVYIVERVHHRGRVDRQLHAAIEEAREHTRTPLVGKWLYNKQLRAAIERARSGTGFFGDRSWKNSTYFSSAFTTQDKELALRERDYSTPNGILFVDPDGYADSMGADGSERPIDSRYKWPEDRPNRRFKNTFGPPHLENEYLTSSMVFMGLKMGLFHWDKLPDHVRRAVREYLGKPDQ